MTKSLKRLRAENCFSSGWVDLEKENLPLEKEVLVSFADHIGEHVLNSRKNTQPQLTEILKQIQQRSPKSVSFAQYWQALYKVSLFKENIFQCRRILEERFKLILCKIFQYVFRDSVKIGFQNKEKNSVKIRHDTSTYFILTST